MKKEIQTKNIGNLMGGNDIETIFERDVVAIEGRGIPLGTATTSL